MRRRPKSKIKLSDNVIILLATLPKKERFGLLSAVAKKYGVTRQAVQEYIYRRMYKLRHKNNEILVFTCKNNHQWRRLRSLMEPKDKFCPFCYEPAIRIRRTTTSMLKGLFED
jgi:hypothetical protein